MSSALYTSEAAITDEICEDIVEQLNVREDGLNSDIIDLPRNLEACLYRTLLTEVHKYKQHLLGQLEQQGVATWLAQLASPMGLDAFRVHTHRTFGYAFPPSRYNVAVFLICLEPTRIHFPHQPHVSIDTCLPGTLYMFPYDPSFEYVVSPTSRVIEGAIFSVNRDAV